MGQLAQAECVGRVDDLEATVDIVVRSMMICTLPHIAMGVATGNLFPPTSVPFLESLPLRGTQHVDEKHQLIIHKGNNVTSANLGGAPNNPLAIQVFDAPASQILEVDGIILAVNLDMAAGLATVVEHEVAISGAFDGEHIFVDLAEEGFSVRCFDYQSRYSHGGKRKHENRRNYLRKRGATRATVFLFFGKQRHVLRETVSPSPPVL